jgi:uncharacterized membrane protein
MPSFISRRASFDTPGQLAMRWAGVFVGPLAWAAVLETNYSMSYVACEQGSKWMLHLAVAVAVVLIVAIAFGTWRVLPPPVDETLPSTPAQPERTAQIRARFISHAALGLSLWFALAILAMEVPAALLQACNP